MNWPNASADSAHSIQYWVIRALQTPVAARGGHAGIVRFADLFAREGDRRRCARVLLADVARRWVSALRDAVVAVEGLELGEHGGEAGDGGLGGGVDGGHL